MYEQGLWVRVYPDTHAGESAEIRSERACRHAWQLEIDGLAASVGTLAASAGLAICRHDKHLFDVEMKRRPHRQLQCTPIERDRRAVLGITGVGKQCVEA